MLAKHNASMHELKLLNFNDAELYRTRNIILQILYVKFAAIRFMN